MLTFKRGEIYLYPLSENKAVWIRIAEETTHDENGVPYIGIQVYNHHTQKWVNDILRHYLRGPEDTAGWTRVKKVGSVTPC